MPPRARRDKRRRIGLTISRALALSIGPDPLGDEPDDVLLEVYREHGERLLADHPDGARPWGWWAFEPEVPETLRATRPTLYPVRDAKRVRAKQEDLEVRRAAWLAQHITG